ncbi:MAG: helix-turn-helix transcriptional regulator [Ruminococcaceae bacterium]|nr:helix-turn-helix transcriptional regulator [Oscillospiraceae bacterium]
MHFQFRSFLPENTNFRAMHKTQISAASPDHHDYHPHYELYYFDKFIKQDVVINGQLICVDKPCVIISAPFSIHGMSLTDATTTDFERYVLYFDDRFLASFSDTLLPLSVFHKSSNCIYPLTREQNETVKLLFELLLSASEHYPECCAYFAAIVNSVVRFVPPEKRITKGSASHYIVDVLKYIYENKNTSVNADTISEQFHVSRAKLDRDFRKFVGQSIHKTVIDCRLNYASELLISTDMQIREIASICGFESEYYFYAFFKRNTGKTPSAVRKTKTFGQM